MVNCRFFTVALLLTLGSLTSAAAQPAEVLLQTGLYDEAAELAETEIERGVWNEKWPRLLMQALITRGRYDEAIDVYNRTITRYSASLALRMLAREALLGAGRRDEAEATANEIFVILQRPAGRYASADNIVAAGRYFAVRREDARRILEVFYDRVRSTDPRHLEAAIATAELAIEKGDFAVAAKTLQDAKKIDDGEPQIDYLLARAYASSDSERSAAALKAALERNPRHIPSLLMSAEAAIDRERYAEAQTLLTQVLEVNMHRPEAWALLAVIAHLRGQPEIEKLYRAAALSSWAENPEVDHLIGRKLSRHYRFAEGSEYQRRALAFDARHPGATFQLAQDLLRLGFDSIGWKLAESAAEQDPYNVVAYNLMTLRDRVADFTILEGDEILVRMEPREAEIYGNAVLELLTEARQVLCEKYEVVPEAAVHVEIFPQQKDFAIRTFGLPGGAGFLGVCFGRVITANSPASQGERPANWKSVLWHEFCHAVTLEKTRNRMPRWLSEGLSVYEERMRSPASGESMNYQYREMLLDEALTPVSGLSSAFLNPPSPIHLQFAYYQSSLVVEFIIERHGFEAINRILTDLGDGIPINDALARSVGSIDRLDAQFADYAREVAEQFAADADWSRDDLPPRLSPQQWADWVGERPDNVWGNLKWAESLIAAGRDEEALQPLEHLNSLGAITGARGGVPELLAGAYRRLGREEDERRALALWVSLADDALPAFERLAEIAEQQEDWERLRHIAHDMLAIQPLQPAGHRFLAAAAEKLQQPTESIQALAALRRFDPADPAGIEYRLAKAYADTGRLDEAARHVTAALRDAPRYREALSLVLRIADEQAEQVEEQQPADEPETDSADSPAEPADDASEEDR